MSEQEKSKSTAGHSLPAELQGLREHKEPERERVLADRYFEKATAPKKQRTPDERVVIGGRIGSDVMRLVTGKAKLPTFQVDVSTIDKDGGTGDRISTIRTTDEKGGIAINVWQRSADGTHRLTLFVVGRPDGEGNLVLEVRTRNDADKLPLYEVKTSAHVMERGDA